MLDRTLVIAGGHDVDSEAFKTIAEEFDRISFEHISWPKAARELSAPADESNAYLFHDHPISTELSDFVLHDECYGAYYVAHVVPLLGTDHPRSEPLNGCADELGSTRAVYLQPGHGPEAFRSAAYEVLGRALAWVSRRPSPTAGPWYASAAG
jgi:hypothetical protein